MTPLNSRIYHGYVMHSRLEKAKHFFQYPMIYFAFDLDELPVLANKIPFFSLNRFNLVSLHDKDYLEEGGLTLRAKITRHLENSGCTEAPGRIVLLTCPKLLGYAFNPVSFFYCYSRSNELMAVAAEVHNTFGEYHLYILKDQEALQDGLRVYEAHKQFHVSPFFDRSGIYEFRLGEPGSTLDIHIDLNKKDGKAILTRLWGESVPFTGGNLVKTIFKYPLSILLTIPRIYWQAAKLYFGKKLSFYSKPSPAGDMTIRVKKPGLLTRLCRHFVLRYLSKIENGRLDVTLPDGKIIAFGKGASASASLIVKDWRFFTRIARDQGVGLGESYMAQDWDSPDLPAVLTLLINNKSYFEGKTSLLSWIGHSANRLFHVERKNTVSNSTKNIRAHYDLGNEIYKLFLDESMTYSSAVFSGPLEPLEKAQERKFQYLIDKARITADCHVLEIGCGWGGFAIQAVQRTGCRVTGITLSREQYDYAQARVKEAGLEDRIEILICDYRKLEGKFDRIVSIEMLEAVGHEYLGTYFAACDRLLKPEGLVSLQVITIPDQRYDSYRKSCDWIQKHIFPGGHLPALGAMVDAMTKNSHFFVENLENIGFHYAETLRRWRVAFLSRRTEILELGFDEARFKAWDYYFSYCEAGFATHYINNLQLVLTRAANATLRDENQNLYGKNAAAENKVRYETLRSE